MGAARVEAPTRLAVRHRAVPLDLACEAGEVRDLFRELANRDLDARTEVDRVGAVVAIRGEHEPFDAVVHVQELTRRRAVAPKGDAIGVVQYLPDQPWNDVRRLEVE